MSDFFTRELKIDTGSIRSFQSLQVITLNGDLFKSKYVNFFEMPDASVLPGATQFVDRSIEATKGDTVDFNGTPLSLTDLISIAALFSEKWRAEDDAIKPPDPTGVGVIAVP